MRHAFARLFASTASVGLVALLAPSTAAASPTITAGVNLGMQQSELDGASGLDPSRTLGLFGRLAFNARLAGQLEIAELQTPDDTGSIRSATASLVVDLTTSGRLVPTIVAGIGMDWADSTYGSTNEAHHIEGGLGLEYRADGGLTIGIDLRMGGRSLHESEDIAYPADVRGGIAYIVPSQLQEGEYRAGQIKIGVRF